MGLHMYELKVMAKKSSVCYYLVALRKVLGYYLKLCGCNLVVECQPSKLNAGVRFLSPAPIGRPEHESVRAVAVGSG